MRGLNVGVRMGLAHEALAEERDAKFGKHLMKFPVASFQ